MVECEMIDMTQSSGGSSEQQAPTAKQEKQPSKPRGEPETATGTEENAGSPSGKMQDEGNRKSSRVRLPVNRYGAIQYW